MRTSEQINELAAALATAQGSIEGAKKDSLNPHFKNKYADLAAVWDACREHLSKNGLSVIQPVVTVEGRTLTITRLLHKSGQWIEDGGIPLMLPQDNMQGLGSALTYSRRYGLMAMVGIAPEDDDGNAASEKPRLPMGAAQIVVPAGFAEWWHNLQDAAEAGTATLEKAWKAARPDYRQHLTATNKAGWERLKALAAEREPVRA